jgi:hypothetical protein
MIILNNVAMQWHSSANSRKQTSYFELTDQSLDNIAVDFSDVGNAWLLFESR